MSKEWRFCPDGVQQLCWSRFEERLALKGSREVSSSVLEKQGTLKDRLWSEKSDAREWCNVGGTVKTGMARESSKVVGQEGSTTEDHKWYKGRRRDIATLTVQVRRLQGGVRPLGSIFLLFTFFDLNWCTISCNISLQKKTCVEPSRGGFNPWRPLFIFLFFG